MKRMILPCLAAVMLASLAGAAEIRDVAAVVGARPNQLVGYGLVVGLKGTGDKNSAAGRAVVRMLDRLGMTLTQGEIRSRSVALVLVTAELPPFAGEGLKIDVNVSTIGDAESLQGGWLVVTPLHGPDPEIAYARAQGSVTFGGAEKPLHPTSGRVPEGAIVEREVPVEFTRGDSFSLALKRPSFSMAENVSDAINSYIWRAGDKALGDIAVPVSPGLVTVRIPEWERSRPVAFISQILRYPVDVDLPAIVVVNERTGTVAVSEAVRVGAAAVSHGDLYIEIPAAAATGAPQAAPPVPGGRGRLMPMEQGVTLQAVVQQLNRMKVTPRDLIAVLDKLIKVGALNAELVVE